MAVENLVLRIRLVSQMKEKGYTFIEPKSARKMPFKEEKGYPKLKLPLNYFL